MFFLSYGAMLAYLTIIKDVLPILFGIAPDDDVMKRVVMAISSLVVILPLSMQRDMADLEKTSRLNVFLNLALVGIVTWYSPVVESVDVKGGLTEVIRQEMVWDTKRFFVGFGVASFAFVSDLPLYFDALYCIIAVSRRLKNSSSLFRYAKTPLS
jgi:sodium-coupled neutral amino acid transporter 11